MMKKYKVVITSQARDDMDQITAYILKEYKNQQAAKNVWNDFVCTRKVLSQTAGSIKESDSIILRQLFLKRINFRSHHYFLLFYVEDNYAVVTNVFNDSQDYERKLGG